MCDFIDVIIPWVNNKDKQWQSDYLFWKEKLQVKKVM